MTDEAKVGADQHAAEPPKIETTAKALLDLVRAENQRMKETIDTFNDSDFIKAMERLFEELPQMALKYVTTMLSIGYAGIFGVWWITKDSFTPTQNLIIGLSLVVSLVTFFGNEMVNVFMFNRLMVAANRQPKMKGAEGVKQFADTFKNLIDSGMKYRGIRSGVLYVSVACACIGVAVMTYGIVSNLIVAYLDP